MMRAAIAPLLLIGLAACATNDPPNVQVQNACRLARVAEVPIESRGDMLFAQARIDNKPVTLLVDTGAERSLLTEATVKRLDLPRDYQHPTRTFGIGASSVEWNAELPSGLVMGGTRFPIEEVTVGHFDIAEIAGTSADGLLGADVLMAFDIDLDLPAQRMTFYLPRPACPDALPPWHQPYIAIDGVITRRDRLLVPFDLDGVAGMAVLDTGAQMSSISRRMAERVGLADVDMAADHLIMAHGAAPAEVKVRIHRFHDFRVGSTPLGALAMPIVPMSGNMGDALVGGNFLHGRRVWLSLSTRRVFVTPLEQGPLLAATGSAIAP